MDWDDFKFVHALARKGTVREAGRLLGVHGSTVVRRLDALERRIQVKLFFRSREGMALTAAGREVLATLEQVAEELESVTRRLRAADTALSGTVRLCGPELLLMLVAEALRRFREAFPDVTLHLQPSGSDRVDPQADLSLLVTTQPPPDLVGRKLRPFDLAVYGRRALLDELAADGGFAPALRVDDQRQHHGSEDLGSEELGSEEEGDALISASGAVRLAAIRSGQGIGLLPCLVGDRDPELVGWPDTELQRAGDLWLLNHPDLRGVARVRAVAEFVQGLLGGRTGR